MTGLPLLRRRLLRVALLAAGCLLWIVPGLARAQTPDLIVLAGDPVPGVAGEFFDSLGPPVINDAGQIAFAGTFDSGGGEGIFLESGGLVSELALRGDTAPGTSGGTFVGFSDPAINDAGDVAFVASVVGGTEPPQGVFLASGGTITGLAFVFDPAVDSGGGFYGNFSLPIGLTEAGEVIVTTGVSAGSFFASVYGFSITATRVIVSDADAAPAPLSGNYGSFGPASASGAGEIAVPIFVFVPTFTTAVVRIDDLGAESVVAAQGGAAPGTGGGSFGLFTLNRTPINDAGDVAFVCSVTGGTVASGQFVVAAGGGGQTVALPGDVAPDTGGLTYNGFLTSPTLSGASEVGFRNDAFAPGAGQGLFLDVAGTDESVAVAGDNAPGVPGSVFDVFPNPPAQSESGLRAFNAVTAGTTATSGIWRVPEPSGGLMLGVGVAALAALVGLERARGRVGSSS